VGLKRGRDWLRRPAYNRAMPKSGSKPPAETFRGRPLSPEELERLRLNIESFDTIEAVDNELRGIVARNWPHLMAKLPSDPDK
jgi:hypothetical protein